MGKWIGPSEAVGAGIKPRLIRAYAEGRQVAVNGGDATDNPEDGLGTPREAAWDLGFDNADDDDYIHETGIPSLVP